MGYKGRMSLLVAIDSAIVLLSIFVVYYILHPFTNVFDMPMLWLSAISLFISHHLFASIYHLYQKAWEYASVGELIAIVKAVTFSVITTAVVQTVANQDIYFRVLVITWMMHLIFIGGQLPLNWSWIPA